MKRMKVVIAEPIKDGLNELIESNDKDWVTYDKPPKDSSELAERVKDADIACCFSVKFDADVLSQSPKLRFLAIPAVGAEYSVDMKYAVEHGVTVMNCPGYNSLAVAEIAIGLAIDVGRSISFMESRMRNGVWANGEQLNRIQISDKKIGLIGYGNVGTLIHDRLKNWCNDFLIVNSKSTTEEIDACLAESDIIFVCCSLNDATKGLVSADRIKTMKNSAIIINVSRGAVIDEDALFEALKSGQIAGAGLDVFVDEPAPGNNLPDSVARFANLKNVVCTPHIGASTKESGRALSQMIYNNIESCINGSPNNVYSL